MKNIRNFISLTLIMALLVCCFTSCNQSSNETTIVTLTTENILDYIVIDGQLINYESEMDKYIICMNYKAELDLQVYSVIPGTFSNVEIAICIPSANWWLGGSSTTEEPNGDINITFHMPANGTYSKIYSLHSNSIVAPDEHPQTSGQVEVTIVSVSGTFTPSN